MKIFASVAACVAVLVLAGLGACRSTPPSDRFVCALNADCPPNQSCFRGVCSAHEPRADAGAVDGGRDAGRSCGAGCDDGLFCNGRELCIDDACAAGRLPCLPDLCDEPTRRCTGAFNTRVRFVHAMSGIETVALLDGDVVIEPALSIGQVSDWISALPLGRRLAVVDAASFTLIAYANLTTLSAGDQSVVLAIGPTWPTIDPVIVPEAGAQGRSRVRFVNAVTDLRSSLLFSLQRASAWIEPRTSGPLLDVPVTGAPRAVFEVGMPGFPLATFSMDEARIPENAASTFIVFGASNATPSSDRGLRAILIGPEDVLTPTLYTASDPGIWALHPIAGISFNLCNLTRGTTVEVPTGLVAGPIFASGSDALAWGFAGCSTFVAPVTGVSSRPDRWLSVLTSIAPPDQTLVRASVGSIPAPEARVRWLHLARGFRDSTLNFQLCAGICFSSPEWSHIAYGGNSPLEGLPLEPGTWTVTVFQEPGALSIASFRGALFVPQFHHLAITLSGASSGSPPSFAVVTTREDGRWTTQWFP